MVDAIGKRRNAVAGPAVRALREFIALALPVLHSLVMYPTLPALHAWSGQAR